MHNEFGHHGIVERTDGVASAHAIVKAHGAAFKRSVRRLVVNLQMARSRQEIVVRCFGANARFNGMARQLNLFLAKWQGLTTGHAQLPLDQIQTRDGFCDRVLYLQARVHFHEEKIHVDLARCGVVALLHNEFNSARTHIIDSACSGHGSLAHLLTQCGCHAGGWCFFQHLLVTALHRAIALHEVNTIALRVAKHLNFDVAWALHIFFNEHRLIAKTVLRFTLARGQGICKVF